MFSRAHGAVDEPLSQDDPSIEERRALIERVASSGQFRRSIRLRDFLLYVGGQSLKDGCPNIHEQEIGAKVFGRPSAYDRGQDNIVRVSATELRKRIELYFASEGAHETLILEIPRGGYKPIFRRRFPEPQGDAAVSTEALNPKDAAAAQQSIEAARPVHQRGHYRLHLVWATVCVAFMV